MRTVSYEVLGPLTVRRNGIRRDVGPEQRQRILAALLLHANQAVPLTDLVAAAWDGKPPADADQVVRTQVAALRDLVDPQRMARAAELLITLADGSYVLCVEPGDSDLDLFNRDVERAGELRAAGSNAEAAKLLRTALALWQGTPLEGLTGPLFDNARAQLADARQRAQEALDQLGTGQSASSPGQPPATTWSSAQPMTRSQPPTPWQAPSSAYGTPQPVEPARPSVAKLVVLKLLGAAVPVVSLGFLGWLVTAGVALKRRSLALGLSAAAYLASIVWFTVYVMVPPEEPELSNGQALVTLLYLCAGIACSIQAAIVIGSPKRRAGLQPPYLLRPQLPQYQPQPFQSSQHSPDAVLRNEARHLASTQPARARLLGIGRPDLPRQFDDGGLIDLNDAPADLLDTLPGVTGKQAAAIVVSRLQSGRFRRVDELWTRGLLPGPLAPELTDRLVIIDLQD
ncbi:BTAD domain-containing putative transcriptional regulator [Kribbella sp. NPDC056861]|uniref:BTAD domain-containing putative transcriptional regulator n=1 Tax=Kribbella sp. NPDC056861 TaxID=3154857 RepID=UPI003419B39F